MTFASRRDDSSRFCAIIGSIVLSWSWLPPLRADGDRMIAHDLRADLDAASQITGFTLPGMIELPGWIAGSWISASPACGPRAERRRSFAIFITLAATELSAPEARRARPARPVPRSDRRTGKLVPGPR